LSITLDLSRASTPSAPAPVNLAGLTRDGLREALISGGVCAPEKAKMRATQVWGWIHHYGVTDFAAMSNIDKETRAVWPSLSPWPGPRSSSVRCRRTAPANG
jgi:23S rRNA (adenine2503-C2)-methyltransferase